jgi:hypothetical protein
MEQFKLRDTIYDKSSFDEQNHRCAKVVGIKPNFIKDKVMLELIYEGESIIRCVMQTKDMHKVSRPAAQPTSQLRKQSNKVSSTR